MPSLLRSRLAIVALLGVFLIPIGISTLRGLTHVLTCRERMETPFSFVIGDQVPALISTAVVEKEEEEEQGRLCGGLSVDLRARAEGSDRVTMVVPITNHTRFLWHGTVMLRVGNIDLPIGVERIAPGATVTENVELRLGGGQHEVAGSLLIGP